MRGPEPDFAHQLDAAVVDGEQDDREHQSRLDARQQPLPHDHPEDRKDDEVFDHGQGPPHVDHPLHEEGEADEGQHPADDYPRDQPDERRAENHRSERNQGGHEPGGPRADVHPLRERRQAEGVVSGDAPHGARHDVHQPGVPELPVRIEVPSQQQLDPADVEQGRDHGDEHRGEDPAGLLEHGPPVRAAEGVERPGLPQPARRERPQQPLAVPGVLDRRARDHHPDREQRDPDPDDRGDHERTPHDANREQHQRAEPDGRSPSFQLEGAEQLAQRVHAQRDPAGRDEDAALGQQPSGSREEAAHHWIRHVPDEVPQFERPEHEERDAGQRRDDEGRGDDGEEGPVEAAEGGQGRVRGDDREHGGRRVLDAAHYATPAGPPGHDAEGERARHEIEPDAVRQELHEVPAEHEGRERDRQDHLDGPDHRAGRDRGQDLPGSSLLGHRNPSRRVRPRP